jgi:hypothetical protein
MEGDYTMNYVLTDETIAKYVMNNQFTLQRYKLKEIVNYLPKSKALSLIRHCYECNYAESEVLFNALLSERD